MTIPCRTSHLFWEPLPNGVAVYSLNSWRAVYDDENWLQDPEMLELIGSFASPSVYVDLRSIQGLGSWQIGRLLRLGRHASLLGGVLTLLNLPEHILEIFQLCRLDRLTWIQLETGDIPHATLHRPDPAWLSWNRGLVPALARTIRESQDHALLPILGDALEDAGCTSQGLLDHLHGPGPHLFGCFALELLLTSCHHTGA